MVITGIVMNVMHFITISCNFKKMMHYTLPPIPLKKINGCNTLPLHITITITYYTLSLPQVCCDCKKMTNKGINVLCLFFSYG